MENTGNKDLEIDLKVFDKMLINLAFSSHEMPADALPIRCLILQKEMITDVEEYLVKELPFCYIKEENLKKRVNETDLSPSEIIANKIPDKGSVMAGDFGEVITLFFIRSECPSNTQLVKKWRYKQDRNKPVPFSDVILLHRENNSKATENDFVICAESKLKSTRSRFHPIKKAIEGFEVDRAGRLARTLVWLKEKAIDQEKVTTIEYIKRFTDDFSVIYKKKFKAVAIIEKELLNEELTREIDLPTDEENIFEILILGISNLKDLYEKIYDRAISEVKVE